MDITSSSAAVFIGFSDVLLLIVVSAFTFVFSINDSLNYLVLTYSFLLAPFQSRSGPIWNTLPDYVRNPIISSDIFKRYLKHYIALF